MRFLTTVFRAFACLSLSFLSHRVSGEPEPAAVNQVGTMPAALAATKGEVGTPAPEKRILQQYGLTFVLGRSARNDNVETEEYFLENETAENWTQMLTYQRVVLPEPLGTDQYVAWLKRHLEENGGGRGRLRVLQQSKAASLFGIQYAKSENSGEQFGLALATVADPRRPNEIHLVQFTLNPTRLSLEEMELQAKRWQARFQSQAASFAH